MGTKLKAAEVNKPLFWNKYLSLCLGLFAFLVFANTISNGYNMDDELVTRKHKYTSKGFSAIKDIFTKPYYSDAMGYSYGYRPMVHVSYAIEHQLFGENAKTSHFINVLLYAITVVVFFRFLRKLVGEKGLVLAILATVLFAIHPVHTEVVASLKNRDEILALLFGLLSGMALINSTERKTVLNISFSVVLFGLSLLSKKSIYPLVIIFPAILVMVSQLPLKKILLYTTPLIFTGALVASEFETSKLAMMLAAPYITVVIFWYIKSQFFLVTGELVPLDKKKIAEIGFWVASPVAIISLTYGIYYFDIALVLIGFLSLYIVAVMRPRVSIPLFILFMCATAYVYDSRILSFAAVLSSIIYAVDEYFSIREKIKYIAFFYVIVSLVIYFLLGGTGSSITLFVYLLASILVFRYKPLFGYILFALLFIGSTVIEQSVGFLQYAVLVLALVSFITNRRPALRQYHFFVLITGFIGLTYFTIQNTTSQLQPSEQNITTISTSNVDVYRKSALQEGRKLEFAENTLMGPHTKSEKVATGFITLGEYARLMIVPYELSFYYGYARTHTVGFSNVWVWLSLFLHLGLIALGFIQFRKRPMITIGIFWYFASIILFSNWIELVAGMVGERLAFTASAGFCIVIGAIIVWIKPNLNFTKPGLVEIVVGIVFLAFGFRTLVRNKDWKDKLTLMGNDINHLSNSAQANNLYALNLMQESFENKKLKPEQQTNMRKLAVKHFDIALQIWPDFFNAAYDKGRASITVGDYATAIEGFEQAVSIERKDVFFDPYYQLSDLYLQAGRYPDLLRNAKQLINMDEKAESYNRLARAYYLNAMPDSALTYLRLGMTKYPADGSLKQNMLEIFKAENKTDSVDYYKNK